MEETLNTIKRRYIHERAIYTWCGIALVAVNPYQEQDIYGDQVVETYHSASHSVYLQLDPHIYAVTEDAYSKLERNLRDQSIIVSGESGAGKTVSAKHAMRYLASIASSRNKLRIENRVLASNPIMEAIGNASTVRNDNSSRFGKYIQIYFDRHSRKILGANMRTYLLEKSRVTKQQPGERNFHVFYQLLNYAHKNPKIMSHLKLLDNDNKMRKFNFLAKIKPTDSRDDLRRFNEALKTLNIDEHRIDIIYRIIAGILHGGNISFEPINEDDVDGPCRVVHSAKASNNESKIHIDSGFHLEACCELIGLDKEQLQKRLTTKLLRTGRDIIEQPQSRQKAEYSRDAMLKYIYECFFNWLVSLINLSLSSKEAEEQLQQQSVVAKSPSSKKSIIEALQQMPQFIGVLDIYGFENFKTNSFEQFCINYANEVLQQQYNQHVFKLEQEEYIREGIDWTFIEYCDNQPVIDVIESKPIGILNLLDEECRMPKGTDRTWCAKLYDQLMPAPGQNNNSVDVPFKRPKIDYQTSFTICHYAEEVRYDVETFLEKNRDTIAEEQSELLCQSEVMSYIFEDPSLSSPASTRPKPKTGRSATVGHQFRGSLAALIRTLNDTEPHYIRCIKPNDEKKAFEFNEERAVQQLKACGVYETIRISNNGFPSRWLYRDFAKRYCVIIFGTRLFEQLAANLKANSRLAALREEQSDDDESRDDINEENDLNKTKGGSSSDLTERNQKRPKTAIKNENQADQVRFMCHFSSADVRPICDAICKICYEGDIYKHLRTKEEQMYIDKLIERHGNKSSAIYQFGKTKLFFRAGQVGYLERIRSQKLRGYTVTIQRHVRGWLARRSFALKREQYLEEMRREASLVSLQNQVSSLQTELEQVKEEKEDQVQESVSRLESMYQLVVEMMYTTMQPIITAAILEYEALDQPGMFDSLESRSSSPSSRSSDQQPMEKLIQELEKFYDLIKKNLVPEDIAVQAFRQIFYLICAQSLNQLLIRRDLCQFRKAMQISFNLSCLVQWCRERYLVKWRDIVEQLDPIIQATKLLQTRKSSEDISTIEEVCNKLRPSQIIKILNMYSSSYEEQITTDFVHELEEYLNKTRGVVVAVNSVVDSGVDSGNSIDLSDPNNNTNDDQSDEAREYFSAGGGNNNDLLLDTRSFFKFIDIEQPQSVAKMCSPVSGGQTTATTTATTTTGSSSSEDSSSSIGCLVLSE